MSIREIILLRIKNLGARQYEVARLAGLKAQNLSTFITGKRSLPYESLERVCGVLGLTLGSINKNYK